MDQLHPVAGHGGGRSLLALPSGEATLRVQTRAGWRRHFRGSNCSRTTNGDTSCCGRAQVLTMMSLGVACVCAFAAETC